jgi:hypothetical protein
MPTFLSFPVRISVGLIFKARFFPLLLPKARSYYGVSHPRSRFLYRFAQESLSCSAGLTIFALLRNTSLTRRFRFEVTFVTASQVE